MFFVPRDAIQGLDSSSVFATVGCSAPSATVEDTEGLSRARPITPTSVTERELESFLQVLYPA